MFTFIYTCILFDSVYRLLSSDLKQYWGYSYVVVSFILFVVTGTTPQPFHPRDLQAASYEKLEIKDGNVYRNVSWNLEKRKGGNRKTKK